MTRGCERGTTLVEILVAVVLAGGIVSASTRTVTAALASRRAVADSSEAFALASDAIEHRLSLEPETLVESAARETIDGFVQELEIAEGPLRATTVIRSRVTSDGGSVANLEALARRRWWTP